MPQFDIQSDAEIFENVEQIDVADGVSDYGFVTAEKRGDSTVLLKPVHPKDLASFEEVLFQVAMSEEEDVITLTQVQMFFWPWEDDEEFEDADSPDDENGIA